ncbi:MAG: ABC transporter permease [Acidimicrobiales bacterium]
MRRYLLRRLIEAVLTLLGVAVLVFLVLRVLPGDEVTARLGTEAGNLTPAQRDSLAQYYGLDRPLVVQFFSWLGSVVSGNLGVSVTSGRNVSGLIADALPVTIELAVLATLMGSAVGVAVGVTAASRPYGVRDIVGQGFGLLGLGVPNFVIASATIAILAARFGYFPSAASYEGFFESPTTNLQQQFYPALTLGVALAAAVMRTTRSAYLEASSHDFVRTAHGKGLTPRRVRWRHILHNSSVPIVTIVGIQFGYLLGGTIIVEEIFALPGMGRLVLTGIAQREYAVVQSSVLVIAAMFVLVNLAVDLVYARIDPRVRLS